MTSGKGQFKLGKTIGNGANGEVFECFDKKNGKKVCCNCQAQSIIYFYEKLLSMVPEIKY